MFDPEVYPMNWAKITRKISEEEIEGRKLALEETQKERLAEEKRAEERTKYRGPWDPDFPRESVQLEKI